MVFNPLGEHIAFPHPSGFALGIWDAKTIVLGFMKEQLYCIFIHYKKKIREIVAKPRTISIVPGFVKVRTMEIVPDLSFVKVRTMEIVLGLQCFHEKFFL